MKKVKFGGKEHDVSDEVADAITDMMGKMKKMRDENDELSDAIDMLGDNNDGDDSIDDKPSPQNDDVDNELIRLQAENDALHEELEKFDSVVADIDNQENFKAMQKEYNRVNSVARRVLKKDELDKLDDADIEEVKLAVINVECPNVKKEKLDEEDYLNARFDFIAEKYANADSEKNKIGKNIIRDKNERTDTAENNKDVAEQARQKSIESYKAKMQKRIDALNEDEAA